MKKLLNVFLCTAMILTYFSGTACAKKTTYIATNQRFNFVKLQEVGMKEAEKLSMTHPAELDGDKLRSALANVKLSRRSMIGDKTAESREVFEESALNYLVPHLIKAFAQAKPNEEVVFSYLTKNPLFIIRNDRLTVTTAWLQGNMLNLRFNKLYAKVQADTDKRGNERRASNNARGTRVSLELGEGQTYAANSTDILMIDLNADYSVAQHAPAVETTSPAPEVKKSHHEKVEPVASSANSAASSSAGTSVLDERSPKERLQMLEQLKKEKLITEDEYKVKRQAVLDQL